MAQQTGRNIRPTTYVADNASCIEEFADNSCVAGGSCDVQRGALVVVAGVDVGTCHHPRTECLRGIIVTTIHETLKVDPLWWGAIAGDTRVGIRYSYEELYNHTRDSCQGL